MGERFGIRAVAADSNDRISLISDRASYLPGDTAEILIPSPFAGEHWAWITVERGSVLQHEVLRLDTNSTVYRLPITAGHAPNIFVGAVLVKGPDSEEPAATHRVGYVSLAVEPTEQEIDIALTPSANVARPGETVTFEIQARLASGKPAANASFAVDLVDKAVLSLRPRPPNAVRDAFYSRRGLGVSTSSGLATSVERLLHEDLEDLLDRDGEPRGDFGGPPPDFGPPAEKPAVDASSAALPPGPEPVAPPADAQPREQFADTAYWDASIATDCSGRATVEIELPDNLTTWVFRAVGVTASTEVGEASAELLATKPLLVRPVTPRFLVVGDRVQLAALVSNDTGSAQEVTVTLHEEGLTLEGPSAHVVSIPDGGEDKVTWWVTVDDVSAVDATVSAVAGPYSDAARPRLTTGPESTLPVRRYIAPDVAGTGGVLIGEDFRTEVIALPPKYLGLDGSLVVRLDPTLAAGMTDWLAVREQPPFEIAEQTVGRFRQSGQATRASQSRGDQGPKRRRSYRS